MGKPKSETVGSYVKNKETYVYSTEIDETSTRWKCSCGEFGAWTVSRPFVLVQGWHDHLRLDHPDAVL